MSPIYRSDQAQLSTAAEAAPGGYMDSGERATLSNATTLTGAHVAGSRSITVASTTGYVAGDYVQIEATLNAVVELRRVQRVVSATVLNLDYPTAFYHAGTVAVSEAGAGAFSGTTFQTFLPGVYETIATPDLQPEILPFHFLSVSSLRNASRVYRGRQTFAGSVPNMILLNGYPLRFGLGGVRTVASAVAGGSSTSTAIARKGVRSIAMTDGTSFANGDFIEIERTGTNPEVRQIISGALGVGAQTFVVNYPFMYEHASGITVAEVAASPTYTHTLVQTNQLDAMTWHLLMRDTDETAANDFIRKFVGGIANRTTLSADEGGMLMFSWDDVLFLDMVHNQTAHSSMAGTDPMPKSSSGLRAPSGVGTSMPHAAGALGTPTFPTNAPYYFSQGDVSFFGVTFARIRNFRLEINNNVDPRYYVRDLGTLRSPSELLEQKREYSLTATVAMPDSLAATAATRTLFKELILEGNYDAGNIGFDVTLTFTRGTSDTITVTMPPAAAATGLDAQGCYFRRAQHSIGTENPVQVDGEIFVRAASFVIVDSVGVYP